MSSTYREVVGWIHARIPGSIGKPRGSTLPRSTFLRQVEAKIGLDKTDSYPTLPLSDGVKEAMTRINGILAGTEGRAEVRLAKPKLIPLPSFSSKAYRTTDFPKPVPVKPPTAASKNMSAEKRTSIGDALSFTCSKDDTNHFESSLRRDLLVESSLDWQLALVADLCSEISLLAGSRAETLVHQLNRTLVSAGRSLTTLQASTSAHLGNILLKRRDAFITGLTSLPDEQSAQLRTCATDSDFLFPEDTITDTNTRIEDEHERENHDNLARMVSSRSQPSRQSGKNSNSKSQNKKSSHSHSDYSRSGSSRQSTGGSRGGGRGSRGGFNSKKSTYKSRGSTSSKTSK